MRNRIGEALILLLALVAAVLLGACGSDEGEGGDADGGAADGGAAQESAGDTESGGGQQGEPGEERRVRVAIEALLVDPDNELVCNEVLSEELLGTAYGDLQGCLNGRAPETLGESVKAIRKLEVDGDRATAVAIVNGGLYDGVPLDVAAVRDGDRWRIERFSADIPVGP